MSFSYDLFSQGRGAGFTPPLSKIQFPFYRNVSCFTKYAQLINSPDLLIWVISVFRTKFENGYVPRSSFIKFKPKY